MRIRTLFFYLIGDSQAIVEIASDKRAISLGALFVLSAGFGRDYDGEDLLHEPWHLAIPFAASLLTSFILFVITYSWSKKATVPSFFKGYRMFLGLFWMTAPLAWLYAIPYERFLSAVDATRANLLTLGVVATWRVVLMTRVLTVLMGYRWWAALALVMTVADIEAIIAMQFVKVPLIEIMGGIRLSPSDALIKYTALGIIQLGVCSSPFWLVGAIVARFKAVPIWPLERIVENPIRSSRSIIVFACASALVWLPILLLTQPEQLLRNRAEQIYENGDLPGFLAELSSHKQSDFPPLYDPPPHFGASWRLLEIVEMFDDQRTAGWVRAIYLEKFGRTLHSPFGFNESQWNRVATVLGRLPEGRALIEELQTDEFGYANGLKRQLELNRQNVKKETEHKATPPN